MSCNVYGKFKIWFVASARRLTSMFLGECPVLFTARFKLFSLKAQESTRCAAGCTIHAWNPSGDCVPGFGAQVWNRTLTSRLQSSRETGEIGSRDLVDFGIPPGHLAISRGNGPTRGGSAMVCWVFAASPNWATRLPHLLRCWSPRPVCQFRDPTCRLAEESCEHSGIGSAFRMRWQMGLRPL